MEEIHWSGRIHPFMECVLFRLPLDQWHGRSRLQNGKHCVLILEKPFMWFLTVCSGCRCSADLRKCSKKGMYLDWWWPCSEYLIGILYLFICFYFLYMCVVIFLTFPLNSIKFYLSSEEKPTVWSRPVPFPGFHCHLIVPFPQCVSSDLSFNLLTDLPAELFQDLTSLQQLWVN